MRLLILLVFFCSSMFAHAEKVISFTQIAAVNLTAAGTAQALSATNVFCTCAVINALAANTGVIYVGDADVDATNGFPLQKGDTITLCSKEPVMQVNLKNIYIDGGTTNDDVKVSCSRFADVTITPKPL